VLCPANILALSGMTFIEVDVKISAAGYKAASQLTAIAASSLLSSHLNTRSAHLDKRNSTQSQIITGLPCRGTEQNSRSWWMVFICIGCLTTL